MLGLAVTAGGEGQFAVGGGQLTHRVAGPSRPPNARIADRVIVLDGGRVAESGTFEELLDSAGVLAELYELTRDR